MSVFENADFDDHEQIIFCRDSSAGLSAIIAIHSTRLGPAAGGCRMYPYPTTEDALTDVLRLSRGMSYKNALAGLKLGGGKAVIIADPRGGRKQPLLTAFAKQLETLNGRYWTAIDVGVGVEDVALMSRDTRFVFCIVDERSGRRNPAVFTALGGFVAIEAVHAYLSGTMKFGGAEPESTNAPASSLQGARVAIQGLGQTGMDLCRRLTEAGARIIATDVNEQSIAEARARYNAEIVVPDAIYSQSVDIFAPCAMGAILNDKTIPRLKAKAVCGIANNQLAEPRHGQALKERGILYAPDYVVNAGGVIYGSDDIFKTHETSTAEAKIRGIGRVLCEIFDAAAAENSPTSEIADDIARQRMTT